MVVTSLYLLPMLFFVPHLLSFLFSSSNRLCFALFILWLVDCSSGEQLFIVTLRLFYKTKAAVKKSPAKIHPSSPPRVFSTYECPTKLPCQRQRDAPLLGRKLCFVLQLWKKARIESMFGVNPDFNRKMSHKCESESKGKRSILYAGRS